MTRRSFLQNAAKTILTMGIGGFFSSHASAGSHGIQHLRQIITANPAHTRMIQWDSPHLRDTARVELRHGETGAADCFYPAYTYFAMDGEAQYIYHAEIPVDAGGGAYRIAYGEEATAWIPLSPVYGNAPIRALFFCDSQCGESYETWRQVYHAAWGRHPSADFAAMVGDLTDNGESAWHWQSFFGAMGDAESPLARHIHVPVLGNHEYYGLNWTAVPPARYLCTFALPDNGSAAFRGHYYSFDMGAVHGIVLDTQFLELGARGEALKREQLDWLMRDAAQSGAPWKLVLMHKDILSYGEYQTEQGTNMGISDVGRVFLDAFDTCGIDLVVSGHVHAYRRRQIRARQTDDSGTLYLLAGPAGNQYFDVPAEPYDRAAAPNPAPSNFLYMEADAAQLRIIAEAADGTQLDAVTLQKDSLSNVTEKGTSSHAMLQSKP